MADTAAWPQSTIRRATSDEAGPLAEVERAATLVALAHVFPPDRFPYPDADVLARWRIVLEDPAVTVLVAERDGGLLGYAAYDDTWLRHLGVHPDHWGTGLADLLTDTALAGIAAGGTTIARLWVIADNHRARRFYERGGWLRGAETDTAEFPPHPAEVDYYRPV
ncbi:MAG: GNAT family N-acetyltransferase [Propionibacteriales bacterium]|nr:GNAT family N-acetyltransferase [Propionibacteriales bacterium]